MSAHAFDPTEPITPSEADAVVARESARRLASRLAKANGTVQLRVVEPDGASETVTIPTAAFRLLVVILAEMASGNAVRLIPHPCRADDAGSGRPAERLAPLPDPAAR